MSTHTSTKFPNGYKTPLKVGLIGEITDSIVKMPIGEKKLKNFVTSYLYELNDLKNVSSPPGSMTTVRKDCPYLFHERR